MYGDKATVACGFPLSPKWGEMGFEVDSCLNGDRAWDPPQRGIVMFVAISEFVSVVAQHSGVDRGTWPGRRVLRVSPGQVCCLLTVLCPSWMLW